MKLFQIKNKTRKKKVVTESRPVVFLNKNTSSNSSRRKAHFFIRKIRQVFIIIASLSLISCLVVGLFVITNSNQGYISPLPLLQASQSDISEIDKKIASILKDKKIEFISIDSSGGSTFHIILKGKQEIIIAGDRDIETQLASLQFIYNRLTMEGREFKRLDLRFDKPVITLK